MNQHKHTKIVATIGPERLDEVPAHFETEDYRGLGLFVLGIMLRKNTDKHQ